MRSDEILRSHPPELLALTTSAEDPAGRETAWRAFLDTHSPLLIRAVQSQNRDHDRTMDRYTFVIERLRADDFRRLREYRTDGSTKFTTWLVVVAKRLAIDYTRRLYGRPQSDAPDHRREEQRVVRRRLTDSLETDLDLGALYDDRADPEQMTLERERRDVLDAIVAELDSDDRLLLTLRFVDVSTARDIADVMGFPSQFHVYRELRRVSRLLRRALRDRGITAADEI